MFRDKRGLKPAIFKKKNRRGQYFITAAIIIIVIIVSFVTVSNYSQRKDTTRLYDLGQELGIESQEVLDYGTYSQLNEAEMKTLMESFIKTYAEYIGETGNLYFVFGNAGKVFTVAYQELIDEKVCLKINPPQGEEANENYPCTILEVTKLSAGTPKAEEFPAPEGTEITRVAIVIEGIDYNFKLKEGENFYFVIWQKIGEEKHVITSPQG